MRNGEADRLYSILLSERYEVDLAATYLFLGGLYGTDFVESWDAQLSRVIMALPDFPGPRANAIDDEASQIFRCEVRRLLYYGPSKQRPARVPYRLMYTIIEPEEGAEGYIRILRLIHGSRPLITLEEDPI